MQKCHKMCHIHIQLLSIMGKLTDKTIKAIKAINKDLFLNDGGGLYLRTHPSGWKGWLYRYKLNGKTNWLDIGTYPKLSLAEARAKAFSLTANRKNGIDPVEQKKQELINRQLEIAEKEKLLNATLSRTSVNQLFDKWMEIDLKRRKDGGDEVKRMFSKDVLPFIGNIAVEDIKKGHITSLTDKLIARGVNRSAKLLLSLLRQMFRFAVDRDIIEFDPTASIRKSKIGGKDTERDRVLSEDEIKCLAVNVTHAGLTTQTEMAVWIAISTCCRIGELLTAKWENIDLDNKTWLIPAEHSKNGKSHTIYLSEFALDKFQKLKNITINKNSQNQTNCSWLYPNSQKDNHVCTKTVTKQLGDRQRLDKTPMKNRTKAERSSSLVLTGGKWTPHDLRRTGATIMVMLGVLPEVAERCLNHTEQNRVKRTYQRHSYEPEMLNAWKLLGEYLTTLTS